VYLRLSQLDGEDVIVGWLDLHVGSASDQTCVEAEELRLDSTAFDGRR
jgi:hypothetical protein